VVSLSRLSFSDPHSTSLHLCSARVVALAFSSCSLGHIRRSSNARRPENYWQDQQRVATNSIGKSARSPIWLRTKRNRCFSFQRTIPTNIFICSGAGCRRGCLRPWRFDRLFQTFNINIVFVLRLHGSKPAISHILNGQSFKFIPLTAFAFGQRKIHAANASRPVFQPTKCLSAPLTFLISDFNFVSDLYYQ